MILKVSEILAKEERVEVLAAVILNALCPEWVERCRYSGELRTSSDLNSVRGCRLLKMFGREGF